MRSVEEWESRGAYHELLGHRIFVLDQPAVRERRAPLLVLHGFPSCSFDWRHVLDAFAAEQRVVLLDVLGYGLSAKPDQAYSLFEQADIVEALARELHIDEVVLVTHDMGDSVGGELLARSLDTTLPFAVSRRVLANGSVYMDLVQLSGGQQFLLGLPDERLPETDAPTGELFKAGLGATFGAGTPASGEELDAQWELCVREGGNRLMPRLIRYIEERHRHEPRWTGAIEAHPAPLTIVWGDADPIAVWPMAERLHQRRPDSTLVRLEAIGHYPMIETPNEFALGALAGVSS